MRTKTKAGSYKLPIKIIGETDEEEEDVFSLMRSHDPITDLKEGDIVTLTGVPPYVSLRLQDSERLVPVFWKIRFIVSNWAFEVHNVAHTFPSVVDPEEIRRISNMREYNMNRAVAYAHAMPHGKWPDTASWFHERYLRKVSFREANPTWDVVLDEAHAPFVGFDTTNLARPFVWDMAPDLYGDGENIGRPFQHEEDTIHTMCLLGMEDLLLGDHSEGVHPEEIGSPRILDPENDIYVPDNPFPLR